jgi:hypothetical protein
MANDDDGEVKHNDGPPLSAWDAWTPEEVAHVLNGIACTWYVVGGWAIDLFLGKQTRDHEDIEIVVRRDDFTIVRDHLQDYRLHVVGDGEIRRLSDDGVPPPTKHQNWVLDTKDNKWRMDVMLEPGDHETWMFRRDESIRAPRDRIIERGGPVPYLRPEGVLLFKAKGQREKDELDLVNCLPRLSASARGWLRETLVRVHPGHDWLKVL